MELKTFVKETLKQVVGGVREAQSELEGINGRINPELISAPKTGNFGISTDGLLTSIVDFDVSLTVTEKSGKKGGGGVSVVGVELGAHGETSKSNSSVNHIKFSVPVALSRSA